MKSKTLAMSSTCLDEECEEINEKPFVHWRQFFDQVFEITEA